MNFLKGQVTLNGSAAVRTPSGVELPLGVTTGFYDQAVVYAFAPNISRLPQTVCRPKSRSSSRRVRRRRWWRASAGRR